MKTMTGCLAILLPVAGAIGGETNTVAAKATATTAFRVGDLLDSMGACVHVQHHQNASKLVAPLKYTGLRIVRDGADSNFDMTGLLLLHREAGVRVCFGPGSGAKERSLTNTLAACRQLDAAGALLAIEGPNEPNNFGGVTYHGSNSTKLVSWVPVAEYQRDLYAAVKSDPVLKRYPVFGVSEAGAQDNNCGLQYLKIPAGAGTLMPDGTVYADFLNCHNYVVGVEGLIKKQIDNQATLAASVRPKCAVDHLYGNHGRTWRKKFPGYSESELATLPKVTTETGWKTDGTPGGDDVQGKIFLSVYLAQFKAGWKYTVIYELTDDPDGTFGFYKKDLTTPRASAHYLHNLTTILADSGSMAAPGTLDYSIPNPPPTVHDLLLQKSDGTFELVVWGEQVAGTNKITVSLGKTAASVAVYDPTVGTAPIQTSGKADSVALAVSDHVLLVEIR